MTTNAIVSKPIFSAVTITAGGSSTSHEIDLAASRFVGYFSLQVDLAGTGTAKIEYELSNDGSDFLTPTGSSDIVTAHTVASGPGADGKDMYSFTPMLSDKIRFKVTETGGADPITFTAWLAVQ